MVNSVKGSKSSNLSDASGMADIIESAAWLQLDVADFLRMPNPTTLSDKRGREALRRRISRQLDKQERAGDPLEIAAIIARLMDPKSS